MSKDNENNKLPLKSTDMVPTNSQGTLFHVETQIEKDGIEMGVLDNGVPYLTESGLARMCGVDRKVINRLAINWAEEKEKPRGSKIQELLSESGYSDDNLYLKAEIKGVEINAYTEPVCLALLEYYAFLADEKRDQATNAFRTLAKVTFRTFIYQQVGYNPEQRALESWRHFHDRIDMTSDVVPDGYFSVFREIAAMIVPMIKEGVIISDKVIPDISVGKAWSSFWVENDYDTVIGPRIKFDHSYPSYYPQAKSNPQPSYAYPDNALGIFRTWLKTHYIKNKLPTYLLNQKNKGNIPALTASKALQALTAPQSGKK